MNKMFINNKKIVFMILFLIILVIAVICFSKVINLKESPQLEQMEYRTDMQPLIDRFGKTVNIESCFWKADIIGNRRLGFSSYWMKGFIMIDDKTLTEIKNKYHLIKVDLKFEKGMTPAITNFDSFEWKYNKELSHEIAGSSFVGEFYIDVINGILYFDLESN